MMTPGRSSTTGISSTQGAGTRVMSKPLTLEQYSNRNHHTLGREGEGECKEASPQNFVLSALPSESFVDFA